MNKMLLPRSELEKIPALIELKGKRKFIYSKALEERIFFPAIDFEYIGVLNKMGISYRDHQRVPNLLEYYDKACYNFEFQIIPIYYEADNSLFALSTDDKKMVLPTEASLKAAFALEEKVKQFISGK